MGTQRWGLPMLIGADRLSFAEPLHPSASSQCSAPSLTQIQFLLYHPTGRSQSSGTTVLAKLWEKDDVCVTSRSVKWYNPLKELMNSCQKPDTPTL